MVDMAMFNVQRPITPKEGKPELQFMCSAYHLIVLYVCVKFDFDFCVEVLQPSQPSGVMSSAVTLPNHTFIGQA